MRLAYIRMLTAMTMVNRGEVAFSARETRRGNDSGAENHVIWWGGRSTSWALWAQVGATESRRVGQRATYMRLGNRRVLKKQVKCLIQVTARFH